MNDVQEEADDYAVAREEHARRATTYVAGPLGLAVAQVQGCAKPPRNYDAQANADLAQRLFRVLHDAGVSFESATLIPALMAATRVPAPVTVTDDMVERACEAFGGLIAPEWEHAGDWEREHVRDHMRAALVAALTPKDET